MMSFPECVDEYKRQMEKGVIPKAYRGLMEYIIGLKNYFANKYPEYAFPGNLYSGYMDMSYFALYPVLLKEKKLKIAIVFLHEEFRFEVWLSGVNKQIQKKYYKFMKDNDFQKYRVVPPAKGVDAVIEHILFENPDFKDLDGLTKRIEEETLLFIHDIEEFLSEHKLEQF